MKDKRKIAISFEREVKTYTEMWHTSKCLLERGVENQKGSFHQFMASLVFTAFTLEAYLNHIGPKLFDLWNEIERLGPHDKLKAILEKLQINTDYGKRPWQVMKQLFRFRNDIAHGKSEIVKTNSKISISKHDDSDFGIVKTKWEKYCTRANAEKAREDVGNIIKAIYEVGQFKNDYPFIHGFQVGSATVIEEIKLRTNQ